MKNIELERAWPAPEPPPGFPDRVLQQLQRVPALPTPALRRATPVGRLTIYGLRALALAAVALALCGVFLPSFLHSSAWRAQTGDVIAAEPRVVSLGERAVAEMSSGAHIQWSGNDVQQMAGEVTYRVVPGTRFIVQTPQGSVAALGTVFRVILADPHEGETMKKPSAIAGASAMLGALLFVSVDQGSVRLFKGEDEVILSAGQSGSVGPDGVPHTDIAHRDTEARGAAPVAPMEPAAPARHELTAQPAVGVRRVTPEAERLRKRVLDGLQARQPNAATPSATAQPATAGHAPGTMVDRTGDLGADSMRVLNHEFIPLVAECYDQARERNPELRGMLAINVELAGAEEVGGIIEAVEPAEDRNQVQDEELMECVRQSAFSIRLPAPSKSGRGSRQLTIPLGDPLD
jgi:hypothetical protein